MGSYFLTYPVASHQRLGVSETKLSGKEMEIESLKSPLFGNSFKEHAAEEQSEKKKRGSRRLSCLFRLKHPETYLFRPGLGHLVQASTSAWNACWETELRGMRAWQGL